MSSFVLSHRKATPVRISIEGRSYSGKTKTSLLLARGLAGPEGAIFQINTEGPRGDEFSYDPEIGGAFLKKHGSAYYTAELCNPFSSRRFIELLEEAEELRPAVIVIDSASHEWSGLGGTKDWASKIEDGGRGFPWRKPMHFHDMFVATILASRAHVICTLRADYKTVAETKENGKVELIKSKELLPDQRANFPYELTYRFLLDENTHEAAIRKIPDEMRGHIRAGLLGVRDGEIIAAHAKAGKPVDPDVESARVKCRTVAAEGTEAMRIAWQTLPGRIQQALGANFLDEMKSIASEADEQMREAMREPAPARRAGPSYLEDEVPPKQIDKDEPPKEAIDSDAPKKESVNPNGKALAEPSSDPGVSLTAATGVARNQSAPDDTARARTAAAHARATSVRRSAQPTR